MIDRLLARPEFDERPPVLVDIGAAGEIHARWRALATASICIAFDPDSRNMDYVRDEQASFRSLHVMPAIVTAGEEDELDFHLTRYPSCSSLLSPDAAKLREWQFAQLFEVVEHARVRATTLSATFAELGIEYVDWYKSDSQGLDLRLFQSIDESIRGRMIAAEFEPGILDSYRGEDKLHALMAYMDRTEYWMSRMNVCGTRRINQHVLGQLDDPTRARIDRAVPMAPGWAEVTYLNNFQIDDLQNPRDLMLGWIVATIEKQHGFALGLAEKAKQDFDDPIFGEMSASTLDNLQTDYDYRPGRLRRRISSLLRSER